MDIKIHSVRKYIEKCIPNPLPKNNEKQVFYRGTNKEFPDPHKPSIYHDTGYIENEDIIFKEALSFFPDEFLAQRTTVEKLILMQHYRFPTRILDISKNPLIALFFACFSGKNQEATTNNGDGIVYMFNVPKAKIMHCDSDTVSVIANLCKMNDRFSITERNYKNISNQAIRKFNEEEEDIPSLIHEIREEKHYFDSKIHPEHITSVVCLRPRMNNPRIVRQDGYFFLFGVKYKKKECAELSPGWIDKTKYTIPCGAKNDILKELDILNINEAFVFPDFEHISADIRERYKKSKK